MKLNKILNSIIKILESKKKKNKTKSRDKNSSRDVNLRFVLSLILSF